ncbi:TolC family protein [uncultured Desulfobacter sp.]|uniref:TolC family protein n=1 Tax=uncultured Desulfobacter sp. TaxID=240139 RepID=UPI0029F4CB1D|nr:TolC family protein [uncultured Desulfobacter sp.]
MATKYFVLFLLVLNFGIVQAGEIKNFSLQTTKLSQNDLIDIVISESETVKNSKIEALIAEQGILNARSVFEPRLEFSYLVDYNYEQNNREQKIQRSTETEYESRDNTWSASLNGLIPFGTQYKLYYELDDPSNSLQTDDEYGHEKRGKIGLELTQPLLKGFGPEVNNANVNIASKNKEISEEKLVKTKMVSGFNAITGYTDIQFYQRWGVLESEILALEKERLSMVKKLVAAGRLSITDIFDIETTIAKRQTRMNFIARKFRKASSSVRQMLLGTGAQTLSIIEATDELKDIPESLEPLPEDLSSYYEKRPDHKQAVHEHQISKIRYAYAKNQRLPNVDLVAEYGITELNESWEDATKGLDDSQYDFWTIGINVGIPIGGKKGKSAVRAAELRQQMTEKNIDVVNALIKDEICSAYAELEIAHKEAVKQKQVLAKLQGLLDQDMKKLKSGKDNQYNVIARKIEILRARIDLYEKLSEFKKVQTSLSLAKGTLLDEIAAR